jgi:hypothetical protein
MIFTKQQYLTICIFEFLMNRNFTNEICLSKLPIFTFIPCSYPYPTRTRFPGTHTLPVPVSLVPVPYPYPFPWYPYPTRTRPVTVNFIPVPRYGYGYPYGFGYPTRGLQYSMCDRHTHPIKCSW